LKERWLSTPTRNRAATAGETARPATATTRWAWSRSQSAPRRCPSSTASASFGLRALEKLEDAFRRSKQRVKLESEALDERYEIFAGKQEDAVWLRELFSPTFIVWLTESAPKKFAFELVDGTLCCFVPGHRKRSEELDEVCAATAVVARRLRDESLE